VLSVSTVIPVATVVRHLLLSYELEDYVVADQEEFAESTGLATESAKSTVADRFSIVCWRQLRTVCQRMFRNRSGRVGGVVRGEI
jgi:hypothetical protein